MKLLLLLFLALPCLAQQSGYLDVFSGLYKNGSRRYDKDFIYLKKRANSPWQSIAEGKDLVEHYKVATGDYASINYPHKRKLNAALPEINVIVPGNSKEIYTNTTIRVRSSIYIVSMCGFKPSITKDLMSRITYKNSNRSNLEDYHTICSYGKVSYLTQDTRIYDNIEIPCNGTVKGIILNFTFNSQTNCGAAEQYSWRKYSEDYARALGEGPWMDLLPKRRIVVILPVQVRCGWAGLGSVGCGGPTCSAYIKGSSASDIDVIMHELGHTQGLSHSGMGNYEYGDRSDVMGNDGSPAQGYLCTNVANQLRLGWNRPIAQLFPNSTVTKKWTIPPTSITDKNYIVLNYSTWKVPFPNLFVSFRSASAKYDNILGKSLNNKVFVHNFNGSMREYDYNRSLVYAILNTNASYKSVFVNGVGGVNISVLSITPGKKAVVSICKLKYAQETLCNDGIDDDCNGLVDYCDPKCGNLTKC